MPGGDRVLLAWVKEKCFSTSYNMQDRSVQQRMIRPKRSVTLGLNDPGLRQPRETGVKEAASVELTAGCRPCRDGKEGRRVTPGQTHSSNQRECKTEERAKWSMNTPHGEAHEQGESRLSGEGHRQKGEWRPGEEAEAEAISTSRYTPSNSAGVHCTPTTDTTAEHRDETSRQNRWLQGRWTSITDGKTTLRSPKRKGAGKGGIKWDMRIDTHTLWHKTGNQ